MQRFLAALVYFTRIPSPVALERGASDGAVVFAPLVGWVVAGLSFAVAWLASLALPAPLAVGLAVACALWVTGAMHEDGWSDYCDGLGGRSREQILGIMRDPATGVYGVVGVVSVLGLRWVALLELYGAGPGSVFLLSLLCGHALSRALAISFMATHRYASEEGRAKSMSQPPGAAGLVLIAVTGLAPLAAMMVVVSPWAALVLLAVVVLRAWFSRTLERRLGGYTGDCLGAVQQLCELVVYVTLVAVLAVSV